MKLLFYSLAALFLTSCAVSTDFYQVYKTTPSDGQIADNQIIFQDQNCTITYNLWADGGDIGFKIYNKTDHDLTLDLTHTFFVLNGIAHEYYKNRVFTSGSNYGTTITSYPYYFSPKVTGISTSGTSVSYNEKPSLTIPPKTSMIIDEYNITYIRYLNCSLTAYPSRKASSSLQFGEANSPFKFYNLITYRVNGDTARLENKFYVSEITNYPISMMTSYIDTDDCGKKLVYPIQAIKTLTPEYFYVRYSTTK